MAPNSTSKPSPYLFFFLVAVVLTIPPPTFSRKFSPATTLLNVSAALHRTRHVLSHRPRKTPPPAATAAAASSSSSFYIHIHPREALFKSPYSDYRSLVDARLSRDSARVESLVSKLRLSLANLSAADLRPQQTSEIRPEALSVPVTSGISQGSGEYFSRIGIGTPASEFYMALDTGSDVMWLQCEPCSDCFQQSDPIFDPSSSSTYRPLSCSSQQCQSLLNSACQNGDQCLYQVAYGDGSFTVGDYATETVSFGNSGALDNIALGCGHDNEGLFVGAAGLLGLGGGPASLTTQLRARSFSYCLVNRDSSSSSTLEFNSGGLGGGAVSAQLIRSGKMDTFYYLGLTGLSVGGAPLSISPSIFQMDDAGNGGIIVDSGTAITRLPTQAYNALRDAFVQMSPDLRRTEGVLLFDTCYDFSSQSSVRVPTVSFRLSGGRSWDLPAANYLIPVDSAGTFCFAFAPTTSSPGIIGNVQQQGTRVNFDLENSRIEFAPNKC